LKWKLVACKHRQKKEKKEKIMSFAFENIPYRNNKFLFKAIHMGKAVRGL